MNEITANFLRPPSTRGEVVADVIRAIVVLSVIGVTIGWGAVQFAVFLLALFGALVPRMLGARAPLDIATGISCLVAAWSNIFHLYTTWFGWDKLVHGVLTGVLVALAVAVGQLVRFLPAIRGHRVAFAVFGALLGLGLGALWEMGEWAGHTFIDAAIFVGYVDTIGDLAYDGLGGLVAGLLLPFLIGPRAASSSPSAAGESRARSDVTAHAERFGA